MPGLEWSEDYSVHIPQMDAQHRQILELLNELNRCALDGDAQKRVPHVLERLDHYAQWHLQREELLLRVRGYPGYAEHKAEHDVYRKKIASLLAKADRTDIAVRVTNFLTDWWKYHILRPPSSCCWARWDLCC